MARNRTKIGTSQERELWAKVEALRDLGLELRRPFERRWIMNMAFLVGKQYVLFNISAHMLQQLKAVRGRIRNVDNQLVYRWARQVADLVKTAPVMSVVPSTTDEEDRKAAKVGDKVLKSFWTTGKMRKKIRQLAGWIYACGNGFLDDRWNPKLGPVTMDEEGNIVYEGDAEVGVWSPFEVLFPAVPFGETDLHQMPWMIKMKWKTLEQIQAMHPEKGEWVSAEDMPGPQLDMVNAMSWFTGQAPTEVDGAMQLNVYIQPNKEFPRGKFIDAANGVILEQGDWPYNHYRIEQFKDIDIPGQFWGKSKLEDAISLQRTWNRTISSIDEYNRTMAKGKYLSPRNSNMEVMPDDTHGEVIEYTPVLGHKPEQMQPKSLPQTMLWALEITKASLQDLFSQHEATRGTNKSDIRSEDMLAFLREQDAHGLIPSHSVFEESLEAVMSRVLKRIQVGYKQERTMKIVGTEGEHDVFLFKGADLKNNTDVHVKRDSSIPESRLAVEQRILRKFEVGLYGPPQDPKTRQKVLQMIDDATYKDIFDEMRIDITYANWEQRVWVEQPTVDTYMVNEYDGHAIHLEEHSKFLKGLEIQKLRLENPQLFLAIQRKAMEHMAQHRQYLQEAQEAQLEAQARFERAKKGE